MRPIDVVIGATNPAGPAFQAPLVGRLNTFFGVMPFVNLGRTEEGARFLLALL